MRISGVHLALLPCEQELEDLRPGVGACLGVGCWAAAEAVHLAGQGVAAFGEGWRARDAAAQVAGAGVAKVGQLVGEAALGGTVLGDLGHFGGGPHRVGFSGDHEDRAFHPFDGDLRSADHVMVAEHGLEERPQGDRGSGGGLRKWVPIG